MVIAFALSLAPPLTREGSCGSCNSSNIHVAGGQHHLRWTGLTKGMWKWCEITLQTLSVQDFFQIFCLLGIARPILWDWVVARGLDRPSHPARDCYLCAKGRTSSRSYHFFWPRKNLSPSYVQRAFRLFDQVRAKHLPSFPSSLFNSYLHSFHFISLSTIIK